MLCCLRSELILLQKLFVIENFDVTRINYKWAQRMPFSPANRTITSHSRINLQCGKSKIYFSTMTAAMKLLNLQLSSFNVSWIQFKGLLAWVIFIPLARKSDQTHSTGCIYSSTQISFANEGDIFSANYSMAPNAMAAPIIIKPAFLLTILCANILLKEIVLRAIDRIIVRQNILLSGSHLAWAMTNSDRAVRIRCFFNQPNTTLSCP